MYIYYGQNFKWAKRWFIENKLMRGEIFIMAIMMSDRVTRVYLFIIMEKSFPRDKCVFVKIDIKENIGKRKVRECILAKLLRVASVYLFIVKGLEGHFVTKIMMMDKRL